MITDDAVVIDVAGLRMRYGTTDVLRDIAFQARRGEVLALLGPNGAGKTTTIEILEGFRSRSAGHVEVLGADPARAGEDWRARVGVVLQSWRDHGKWRVRELLTHLGAYYTGYTTPWDPDELIAAVGLVEQSGQKIRTLSGGQAGGSTSPSAWRDGPRCSSSTSRPRVSTRRPAATSTISSVG